MKEIPVTYKLEIEEEDTAPEGNASAIDPETDAEILSEIRRRLDRGDLWAWCVVKVTAEATDASGKVWRGTDYLGGCNYRDEADFKAPGGYWDDMCERAYDDLVATLKGAEEAAERARALRAALAPAPTRREEPARG